ncbi:MAG: carbon-nitrogen hydrolase family protein [Victivallales bacterium]|nr:carbon-nitrogen hydrolase family protein [Victivallales bacterium]
MKATILQPPYPMHHETQMILDWQSDALRALRPGETDLVVIQENSNCTGYNGKDDMLRLLRNEGAVYVKLLQETADRVGCVVMAGIMTEDAQGVLRNQLGCFQPNKPATFPYTKNHLVQPELDKGILPGDRADAFEVNGIRYGAAICFDMYFTELFQHFAKQRIDIMLVLSHQRQEPGENLDFLTRARAFDCGCTLLRSAPAMENPAIGGRSMAVAPDGKVLANAGGVPGVLTVEFDPHARFMRPASYGEPDRIGDYREVIQKYQRPELYR